MFPKLYSHKKIFYFKFNHHFAARNKTIAMRMPPSNIFRFLLPFIFGSAFHLTLMAQTVTITGTVTGNNNEPLPGVTIADQRSRNATVSGAMGQFSINVASASSSILFTYTGYEKFEWALKGQTVLSVNMQSSKDELTNVVVVGYGTQRKIATTGSIASIKAEDITQTPIANVAQGLQARVSGVQITQNSSAPGGNISVRIRGTNSINGTSEPLYIIDGLQISNGGGVNDVSPLSTINPNDIESVDVLKDASATAIYGARGANGVILITTKRGKSGATRVSYDVYYGLQKITKKLSVMDASQFAALENETYNNPNLFPNPLSLGKGTDWQDIVYRKAPIQDHQLSVTGGSEKTQLALALNYFNQDGIAINSNFKRYSLRTNIDHRINDRFKIGASIFGSYSINQNIPTGQTSIDGPAITGSLVGAALGAPPTLLPYRPNGTIFPFGDQVSGGYREVANPLGLAAIKNETATKRTLANLYGEAAILPGLTYRASFNVDLQSGLNNFYSPISILGTADINAGSGNAGKGNSNNTLLLHESILTYAKTFAGQHSVKFTGVFASQGSFFNSNNISAQGFPNDATQNEALQLAVNRTVSSFRSKERLDSYLGRINYGFRDKLFLDLTARVDGSSKFGESHKYGFFPAISGAWRIIAEKFASNINFLSDLKLRASYGLTGNAGAISPYNSLAVVASGASYEFNNIFTLGINPTGIANPELKWESSVQANIGLDIGLFNNRLSFVIDAYQKRTKDLLYTKTLPLSSGYGSVTGNFAELENKGFEFATNVNLVSNADLKWDVAANLSVNRNKVISLDQGVTKEVFVTPFSILKVGEPLGMFKTYVFDGIYQTGEKILPGSGSRIGGVKVSDVNKDGQVTADDQLVSGNPNPDFIYGFSNNLRYKNFDMSAFFAGSQGNEIYNLSRYTLENPLGQRNVFAALVNRWSATNANNEYISPFQGGRLPISDRFVEDGSYLRCKNITLGYTLPRIKGINNLRIYVSANNVFTVTRYSGYDPEVNTYGNSNRVIGVDNLVYPSARSFLGGIRLTL
ncbi:MAG: TonB-dependent receptor [Chitinophagaceae bacterium]